MDIEVNEYVRTKDGVIGKVIKVLSNRVFLDNLGYAVIIKDILKHSKQLIGVIECGDFVNGLAILHIEDNKLYAEWNNDFEEYTGFLENKDIKTILTKESYMANCYKVGGEDE